MPVKRDPKTGRVIDLIAHESMLNGHFAPREIQKQLDEDNTPTEGAATAPDGE